MTCIEPNPPGPPEPEVLPPTTPGPDLDPSGAPEEMPPFQPGGGDPGDSPTFVRC